MATTKELLDYFDVENIKCMFGGYRHAESKNYFYSNSYTTNIKLTKMDSELGDFLDDDDFLAELDFLQTTMDTYFSDDLKDQGSKPKLEGLQASVEMNQLEESTSAYEDYYQVEPDPGVLRDMYTGDNYKDQGSKPLSETSRDFRYWFGKSMPKFTNYFNFTNIMLTEGESNHFGKTDNNYDEVTDDIGAYGRGHTSVNSVFRNAIDDSWHSITFRRVMAPNPRAGQVGVENDQRGHVDGNNEDFPNFKLVLVGDSGTGKTTYATRYLSDSPNIILDDHVRIYKMKFDTNSGPIYFHCWDIGSHPEPERYLISAHCAVIMFDITNRESFRHTRRWRAMISSVCDNIPVVLCGNKIDRTDDRAVRPRAVARLMREVFMQYFELSARGNYNWEKPFLYLSRQLLNSDIQFMSLPALAHAEVEVDLEAQARYEAEFEAAHNND